VETVAIGQNPNASKALIFVAEERGIFSGNGLKVVLKDYDSGPATVKALLKGEVDLATCAEFVIVGSVLRKEPVRNIATFSKFQNTDIIGRTDKGVSKIADLKGKKIGLAMGTSLEFFLARFLDLHGMSIQEVTLVNFTPAQSVDALVNGSVDAVAVFDSDANRIKQKLGSGIVSWPAQAGQLVYFNIVSTDTWTASHPEAISRLLRSLIQAEKYVVTHPEETKAIVKKWARYDEAYVNAVWPEYQFYVSLDQGLIVAMEDEARWMISNNLTSEKEVPDFLNYIHIDGLKEVKPEVVNIIR
jgi:NitT/TauT family transport system substrate-binding protein